MSEDMLVSVRRGARVELFIHCVKYDIPTTAQGKGGSCTGLHLEDPFHGNSLFQNRAVGAGPNMEGISLSCRL